MRVPNMHLLQIGPRIGGPFGVLGLLLLLVVAFFVGRYVYRDADRRGMNGTLWGLGTAVAILVGFVPGLVVLVVYLLVRN